MRRSTFTIFLALGALLVAPATDGASFPAARGHGGAVASAEPASTEVGLEILRAGGNAVDAAVATALALAVVHPQAGNLGGGGFAVVRMEGQLTSLDFREIAPAAATREMYLDTEGRPVKDASIIGPLAAGVPGSPVGLYELHQRFGSLAWPRVLRPAQLLASDGFLVTSRL
ncbi:MAG: gamma-glutamyltransferase, partial [Thermoanaerobaculia bacterium]